MISQNPQQMLGLRLMAKRGWMLTEFLYHDPQRGYMVYYRFFGMWINRLACCKVSDTLSSFSFPYRRKWRSRCWQ